MESAKRQLRPGGVLVTLDAVFHPGQNPVARLLARLDRGGAVRTPEAYRALLEPHFAGHRRRAGHGPDADPLQPLRDARDRSRPLTASPETPPPPLRERIRCHLQMPEGHELVVGRDLVLEPPPRHLVPAPFGTLLDDHFTMDDRVQLNGEASSRLAAWQADQDAALTVGDACLPWIWEVELMSEVYLPVLRGVQGLRRVLERSLVRHVEVRNADPELAGCLSAALGAAELVVDVDHASAVPVPSYPSLLVNPWKRTLAARLRQGLIRPLGVPGVSRGNVYFLPYWSLQGLHRRLLGEPALVPVHDPFMVPAGPLGWRLRALARGGWSGRPNALQVARSTRRVHRAVKPPAATAVAGLEDLLEIRSRRVLEQRAGDTPAMVRSMARVLSDSRVRGAILPFDSPPFARMVLSACRVTGRPSVLVQHGFHAEPMDPDKAEADLVTVWSEHDREALEGRRRGPTVVTGNPAADRVTPSRIDAPRERTMVLTDLTSRLSMWPSLRMTAEQLEMSLEALTRARPGTSVILRPHPGDWDVASYEDFDDRFPELNVEVDQASSIDQVIARCDLCLSGVSTATLQAAMAGLPVVFVNPGAKHRPWPFDGGDDGFPMATDVAELVDAIPKALARRGELPPASVLEAYGVTGDATERIVDAARDLFAQAGR